MNIRDLKKLILEKKLPDTFLILECPDNFFVANQYIKEISTFKNKEIVYVDSILEDVYHNNFIYIYTCDVFEDDILPIDNCIIRCKECKNNNLNQYVVTIPKLERWQIQEYILSNLPKIGNTQISWICDICKNDIYRIDNEIRKLKIFEDKSIDIFNKYNMENGYRDLSTFTIYDISNNIIIRDINKLSEVMSEIDSIKVEAFSLINLLIKGFKNIIKIQTTDLDYYNLNMSEKQYNYLKNNGINKYSSEELFNIYKFLVSLDSKIKLGKLKIDNVVDYIIINIIGG